MPVRDLLWACPLCRAPGAIRPAGRTERCSACGAEYRRGRGARIVARRGHDTLDRPAGEWLRELGPPAVPAPAEDGLILGPDAVKVKFARRQQPLHWRTHMLGWVELYDPAQRGTLLLRTDGLRFAGDSGDRHWRPEHIKGLQPASSSIQLRLGDEMASVKFVDGSVRLWTRALIDMLRDHHRTCGREVVELQPCIRTRPLGAA
jgi:hypothetical protein